MEAGNPLTINQLDYQGVRNEMFCPHYEYVRQSPYEATGETVTINAAGGQVSTFEISANVINTAKSWLEFELEPTASGAGRFNYLYTLGLPMIQQVQLYDRTSQPIVDLQRANMWYATAFPYLVSKEEMECLPLVGQNCHAGIAQSDVLRNNIGARRPNNSNSVRNYHEPQYLQVGTANAQTPVLRYRIPLKLLGLGTLLSEDLDMFFARPMYLRIVWAPTSQILFTSTSATNPTSSVASYSANVTLKNLRVYQAIETNPVVAERVKQEVMTNGLSVLHTHVQLFQYNLTGDSQSVVQKLNRAYGIKLRAVLHALYNNTTNSNTVYDHNNSPAGANNQAVKVRTYHTEWNNFRIQQADLNCDQVNRDDFRYMAELIKDSAVHDPLSQSYNFCHIDNFSGFQRIKDVLNTKRSCGYSLDGEQIWTFRGNVTVNAQHNHMTFCITERILTITPQGLVLDAVTQ